MDDKRVDGSHGGDDNDDNNNIDDHGSLSTKQQGQEQRSLDQQQQEENVDNDMSSLDTKNKESSTSDENNTTTNDDSLLMQQQQQWTAITIIQSLFLFVLAGIAEILGGWMVWMAIRGNTTTTTTTTSSSTSTVVVKKPWWYALCGSLLLVAYGFIPCLQPMDSFGRIYAAYGGFFIVMSFLFGWMLDGDKPDIGDVVGGSIALMGVFVILFWPRN